MRVGCVRMIPASPGRGTTEWDQRWPAAGNHKTPPEALASLMGDGDEDVRAAAAANPALPEEYRSLLLVVA